MVFLDFVFFSLDKPPGVKLRIAPLYSTGFYRFRFTDFNNNEKYDWEVFAFLFKIVNKDKLNIDWEHSEYRWISPSEIVKYDTVPHLKEVVSKLLL